MILFILLLSAPLVLGQLFLGPCPYPPKFVENLDYEKYSGTWYVVAQTRHHPMNALECQQVKYTVQKNGLNAQFNTSKNYSGRQMFKNGTVRQEFNKKAGELSLSLNDFPRRYQFRVLHVNYPQVAVEYICLSGVFNYTASVTVLHRQPVQLRDVNSGIQALNLTAAVPYRFRSSMVVVNHTNCSS